MEKISSLEYSFKKRSVEDEDWKTSVSSVLKALDLGPSWDVLKYEVVCEHDDAIPDNGQGERHGVRGREIRVNKEWLEKMSKANQSQTTRFRHVQWAYKIWRLLKHTSKAKSKVWTSTPSSHEERVFNPQSASESAYAKEETNRHVDGVLSWLQESATPVTYLKHGKVGYQKTLRGKRPEKLGSLDPDVWVREHVDLQTDLSREEKDDVREEETVLWNAKQLIRMGKWHEAETLFRDYGQSWRVASLSGRQMWHDRLAIDDPSACFGNIQYLLWLHSCQALCRKSPLSEERWIYAVCCGAPDVLVQGLRGWEDMLWALLQCFQRCQFVRIFQALRTDNLCASAQCRKLDQFLSNKNSNNLNLTNGGLTSLTLFRPEWQQRLQSLKSVFAFIESQLDGLTYPSTSVIAQSKSKSGAGDHDAASVLSKTPVSKAKTQNVSRQLTSLVPTRNNTSLVVTALTAMPLDTKYDKFKAQIHVQYYQICKTLICSRDVPVDNGLSSSSTSSSSSSSSSSSLSLLSPDNVKTQSFYDQLLNDCFTFIQSSDPESTLSSQQSQSQSDVVSLDYLRFVLHLYLYLYPHVNTSNPHGPELSPLIPPIVRRFVHALAQSKQYHLVAPYCLILTHTDAVQTYAEFLQGIKDPPLRIKLLKHAQQTLTQQHIVEIADHIIRSVWGCDSDSDAWKQYQQPLSLTPLDLEKIEALELLLQNSPDSDPATLHRVNQLLALFAREYKEAGYFQILNLLQQHHFRAKNQYWELYSIAANWFDTWQQAHQIHSKTQQACDAQCQSTADSLFQSIIKMLTYHKGWLNPQCMGNLHLTFPFSVFLYISACMRVHTFFFLWMGGLASDCAIHSWKWRQVHELRGVVLMRILSRVAHVCQCTGKYEFKFLLLFFLFSFFAQDITLALNFFSSSPFNWYSLNVMKYVADEKYQLYKCLTENDMKKLLSDCGRAQMQLLQNSQKGNIHL
ncbi:hypothetical protein RFI_40242 [Reticulomyxa filosa]|uniref:Nuclear pore complex protein n=1 Tax=Reticulomyxa filosa TaxID=46433 RepID=X6L7G9_RETFI|nr:hypothetical protein RFI_40242 [Reticulomyxa filosa]|eukprot:ETN97290.1 hypothetical protein RFI_40242 [Reticulomyxa filosa]